VGEAKALSFMSVSITTTKNTTWQFAKDAEIGLTWEKAGESYEQGKF